VRIKVVEQGGVVYWLVKNLGIIFGAVRCCCCVIVADGVREVVVMRGCILVSILRSEGWVALV